MSKRPLERSENKFEELATVCSIEKEKLDQKKCSIGTNTFTRVDPRRVCACQPLDENPFTRKFAIDTTENEEGEMDFFPGKDILILKCQTTKELLEVKWTIPPEKNEIPEKIYLKRENGQHVTYAPVKKKMRRDAFYLV